MVIAAIGIAQVGDDAGEDVVGVGGRRAVEARMQVAVGGVDEDLLGAEAAQAGGDGGGFLVPHVGVADHGDIGAQFVRRGIEEARQVGAARFLFAFQQDR